MFPGVLTRGKARKAEVSEPMTLRLWRGTPWGISSAPPPAGNTPARIMLQPLPRPGVPVKPIAPDTAWFAFLICTASDAKDFAGKRGGNRVSHLSSRL
jgi:hypothetical protein